MKKSFLLLVMACFWLAGSFAQTGAIVNLEVAQRTDGSGLVDIHFDLNGTGASYNLQFEASFDDGVNYEPLSETFLTGELANVLPGAGKHIIWAGKSSHPETFSTLTRVRVIAIEKILIECGDPVIDQRDGKTYSTVQIGEQCWMAENLNIGSRINGIQEMTDNGIVEKYCYNNEEANCDVYGGLYQWDEMMNYNTTPAVQGICPTGWHVPTDVEWTSLTTYVSSKPEYLCNSNTSYIAKALASNTNWISSTNACAIGNDQNANNATNFSCLPGGYRSSNGVFGGIGSKVYFWSSTEYLTTDAWLRYLGWLNAYVTRFNGTKVQGYSVLCLKDDGLPTNQPPSPPSNPSPETGSLNQTITPTLTWDCSDPEGDPLTYDVYFGTDEAPPLAISGISEQNYPTATLEYSTIYYWKIVANDDQGNSTEGEVWSFTTLNADGQSCPGMPTVTDIDGNVYNTVLIGNQCWMKENLKTTKYRNNTPIEYPGSNNTSWQNNTTGAFAWYDNNLAYKNTYGALYNWYALNNSAGLCPTGWHIPSDAEWTTLTTYVSSQPKYLCNGNTIYIAKALAAKTNWNTYTGTCTVGNNLNDNNATNFSGLPGSNRFEDGSFFDLGTYGGWWSSSLSVTSNAWCRSIMIYSANVSKHANEKSRGFSVRCIKDY